MNLISNEEVGIIIGDEKWIYFDKPVCKRSWVDPGQPSQQNMIFTAKQCHVLCMVEFYITKNLLKSGEMIYAQRHGEQLSRFNEEIKKKRERKSKWKSFYYMIIQDLLYHQ